MSPTVESKWLSKAQARGIVLAVLVPLLVTLLLAVLFEQLPRAYASTTFALILQVANLIFGFRFLVRSFRSRLVVIGCVYFPAMVVLISYLSFMLGILVSGEAP